MPVVFRERGFRFYFFSNEGDPREPLHIHVLKDGVDAKLWLYPEVAYADNNGFDVRTRRWIAAIVEARRNEIEGAWHDHFGTGA
ncbi:DUF4160 domain-containing protein [Sphingomonas sp. CFBP 8760]|uniref:DUF4160 domain-containing protein n=1 Tax=Sphingomonas sp. CFBP 8760 TaxID=2775282 RepID=UPI00178454DD|nr:DUF4160 domain-containing protein [Sphingomonas sp. CFBP 8760]MBD8545494.1 DUF4160 domain-containing protein [Sphingomonas sp. CFBP 8760]